MGKPSDLLEGTLDLVMLKTILLKPMHGWAAAQRIEQVSGQLLQVHEGSLDPALHRLKHQGPIIMARSSGPDQQGKSNAKWARSETGRQAKFYALSALGPQAV